MPTGAHGLIQHGDLLKKYLTSSFDSRLVQIFLNIMFQASKYIFFILSTWKADISFLVKMILATSIYRPRNYTEFHENR